MRDYVHHMLSPENQEFLSDFTASIRPFMRAGHVNSLTQAMIKLTAPGVPDIYQGSEARDLSLVDPDNRREPDFDALDRYLAEDEPLYSSDEMDWQSGRLKLNVMGRLLRLRAQIPDLFSDGDYLPLDISGKRKDNIIAFARHDGNRAVLVVAPRLVLAALQDISRARSGDWAETRVTLPQPISGRRYKDVFTGRSFDFGDSAAVNWLFADHPFSVLVSA
ncbi:hypothetical protein N7E02_08855 [Aliirhizobium terrae]|nr:hypothetical protein [Rhizobium sp. CC-CFT758]WJH40697.1 hypothetical protein N7E02_08855 [Rhizobium sp. CC-CFT758]